MNPDQIPDLQEDEQEIDEVSTLDAEETPLLPTENDNSLAKYFRDIRHSVSSRPLLTKNEEKYYGKVIQKTERPYQILLAELEELVEKVDEEKRKYTREETRRILELEKKIQKAKKVRDGDAARAEAIQVFAKANTKLVIAIAKKFQNRGLDFCDLIGDGNVGLMIAIPKFDPEKGFKFATYASWWIRHSIRRAIADKGRTVRITAQTYSELGNLSKIEKSLFEKLNRQPTVDEVVDEICKGHSVDQFCKETEEETEEASVANGRRIKPSGPDKHGKVEVYSSRMRRKVSALYLAKMGDVNYSLDRLVSDEGEDSQSFGDFLSYGEDGEGPFPSADSVLQLSMLKWRVSKMIARLSVSEQKVLRRRFFDVNEPTLEVVGNEMGLTRERIRQLQEAGLAKLRKALKVDGEEDGDEEF